MTLTRTVFDIETGEQIIEDVSAEETAQLLEMHNARLLEIQEINEEEEVQASFVELARGKLLALGLSEEEVEAILGPEPKVIDEDITNLDPVTLEPVVEEPVVEPVEEPVVEPIVEPVVEDEAAE